MEPTNQVSEEMKQKIIIEDLKKRWLYLGQEVQLQSCSLSEWNNMLDRIIKLYCEPFRGHHNLEHIHYCYQILDEIWRSPFRDINFNYFEVAFCIPVHDSNYNPFSDHELHPLQNFPI